MTRAIEAAREWLFRPNAESDNDFREEILRRSWKGLRLVGGAMVVVPAGMLIAVRLLAPFVPAPPGSNGLALCIVASGAAALLVRQSGALYGHSRLIAGVITAVVSYCVTWSTLLRAVIQPELIYLVNAQLALILLIALIAVPFKPIQILVVGLSAEVFFLVSHRLAVQWTLLPDDHRGDLNLVFLCMVNLLATVIAANQYRQILETHRMYEAQLRASNELRDTQCRILLSDNAASMGRLAAALSHELNNPLGVLKSNVDLVRKLTAEARDLPPEKRAAAAKVRLELCDNSRRSIERLEETVRRMQRFTNLDRADVMPLNLNALVRDVAEIVTAASERGVRIALDLEELPDMELRPQAMTAVLSAVLQNAVEASREGTEVQLESRREGDWATVRITDHGPGMSAAELEHAMEPSFRVRENRISACNWNLFGARQIVRQHGGEIEMRSAPAEGTTVAIRLRLEQGGGAGQVSRGVRPG